ncbi:PREDICTED: luciferin 4-monooxygenase, partial [Ceratosolen solmsi marchali]|uniref:Luciferin 4-monooxygenase n=1 Tax=Ceratosolen solmsi marchali TaxID=326594 RepID=A0AAJ6YH72_9HYME
FTIENNIIKGVEKIYNIKEKSVGKIILNSFNSNLNHVSQIEAETGKHTTYAEMKENSIRCALWLQKQGIKSGDIIVLCTNNHLNSYIPFVATYFVGAVLNPWYHEQTIQSARHFMKLTKPKVIFTINAIVDVLKEAAKLENVSVTFIIFDNNSGYESLKNIMAMQRDDEVNNFQIKEVDNPKDFALIMFSSGTTGLPKAVVHSYRSLLNNLSKYLGSTESNIIFLCYASIYWVSGTLATFQILTTRATRIFHNKFDPDETCKCIQKFKVSAMLLNTGVISYLCKSNVLTKYDLSSIESIIIGGSKLSLEIGEEFNKNFHIPLTQVYGMTEIGSAALIQTREGKHVDSVGFVVPNVQLKIIDLISKEPLGPNKHGELYIKTSATMMDGYYNNEKETKETLDDEGWLRTGDIAYYSEIGEFFIVDRIKEIIKIHGHHVSPIEIESLLLSHPAVLEVAVVPVPHKMEIERAMAFIKKTPGFEVTEEELVKMTSQLGDFKTIKGGIKFLDDMPYTSSGKIDRKKIKEMAKAYAL